MAQKVLVQLIDDLDGTSSDDVTTVQFGLDGVTYEIDLTESNADRLRDVLADYVGSARRTGGRVRRGGRPGGTGGAANNDAGQIREWAQANGIELAARGRIPSHVAESYRQAQADEKTKATTNGAPKRRSRAKKS
ncbi:MAG: Lsr2 family protein [Actinophytocola sp.]|uniref:histone-like nucleoid-structuring protein Lsr2 n=1 Tax=Actinophytocola sp. TaxID=1872138 RepID=UPI0013273486|nr:Lsr2 family protein [Actinophytocola sp.]MPZ83554.1 Lsr2 family protein [Actinophytocola sp.]